MTHVGLRGAIILSAASAGPRRHESCSGANNLQERGLRGDPVLQRCEPAAHSGASPVHHHVGSYATHYNARIEGGSQIEIDNSGMKLALIELTCDQRNFSAQALLPILRILYLATPTPTNTANRKSGFVWRVARPSDLVCVTPESRARGAGECDGSVPYPAGRRPLWTQHLQVRLRLARGISGRCGVRDA